MCIRDRVTSDSAAANTPPACPEKKDPGDTCDKASLILVDREEPHGICKQGDEDWFKFGGVANKVYTIAITAAICLLAAILGVYSDSDLAHAHAVDRDRTPAAADGGFFRPALLR